MTEKTIVATASASSNSPDALAALALIELSLAEPFNARAQSELDELIEKWGRTLRGVDPVVVDGLIDRLRAIRSPLDGTAGPLRQAS